MFCPKAVRNALIIGGIGVCSSLAVTGTPTIQNVYTGLIAGGLAFFTELAFQYGLPIHKKGQTTLFF